MGYDDSWERSFDCGPRPGDEAAHERVACARCGARVDVAETAEVGAGRSVCGDCLPDEAAEARAALEASVRLQSHYAGLLNQYDGGARIGFADAAAWVERLKTHGGQPPPPAAAAPESTDAWDAPEAPLRAFLEALAAGRALDGDDPLPGDTTMLAHAGHGGGWRVTWDDLLATVAEIDRLRGAAPQS